MFPNHHFTDLNASIVSANSVVSQQAYSDIPAIFIPYEDLNSITNGGVLGHGSFGDVRQAVYVSEGKSVALKVQQFKDFLIEVKQLARFDHVNIVKLYGWTIDGDMFGIVMELMDGGSLHKIIRKKNRTVYNISHALSWCLQAARGLEYLHGMKPKKVIHRDIKPLNLLLDKTGLNLKICDFGTTCDLHTLMSTQRGTFVYMAPEVFRGEKYDEKCDVYSWAVTFWQCLAREDPFKKIENPFALMFSKASANLRLQKLKNCPNKINDMIEMCTYYSGDKSFMKRYSMTQVVSIMEELFQKCDIQPKPLEFVHADIPFINDLTPRRISDGTNTQQSFKPSHMRSKSSGTIVGESQKGYLEEHQKEVEAILKEFNAYMLLDERYRPIAPDIHNGESLQIFREHRQVSAKMLKYYLQYKNLETYFKELQLMKSKGDLNPSRLYINHMDDNTSLKKLHTEYLTSLNQQDRPSDALDPAGNFFNHSRTIPNRSEDDFVFVRHQDATIQ